MYQIGAIILLKADDPKFEHYWDAVEEAWKRSVDDSFYGIWDLDNNAELLAIVYQGELFDK